MNTPIRLPGTPARPAQKPSPVLRSALAATAAIGLGIGLLGNAPMAYAACIPDPPSAGGIVTCTGNDETGFDARAADDVTIQATDPSDQAVTITDDDPALDGAILVEDNSTVEIGTKTTVTVNANGGYGIRGDDDNFIENKGTIVLQGNDSRAISIDQNTTGILPNGGVNRGTIQIHGLRSYGVESGDNSGVFTSGTIQVQGDESRGLSGGSHLDYTKPANVTNTGLIAIESNDSFGMKFGDGWLDGSFKDVDNDANTPDVFVPVTAGIHNATGSTIQVIGARSKGIFAGLESNAASNHNSFVNNGGTIAVTGTDAIGVSVGGNDRMTRFDISTLDLSTTARTASPIGLVTFNNSDPTIPSNPLQNVVRNPGTISGDEDSGPLVVFHDFHVGNENRLFNPNGASILANLTNQGSPDRAIAIRGSAGDELILNAGRIRGDVELSDGDDRYVYVAGAEQDGKVIGGVGQDEVFLSGSRTQSQVNFVFNLAQLQGVEALRIIQGTTANAATAIWQLTNGSGFDGLVELQDKTALDIPTSLSLGGNFSMVDGAGLRLTLDGPTVPLTIQGSASLAGLLIVQKGPNLAPSAQPYRLIQAGSRTGEFEEIQFPNASGTRRFSSQYDAQGLEVFFQDVGLLGVANTANQRSVAQYLIALQGAAPGSNQTDLQGVLDDLTSYQDISAVYDALSADIYDPQTTVSVEAGRKLAALLFDRPRECVSGETDPWRSTGQILPCHARRLSPFVTALGSFRQRDKFGGHGRYDAQMGGVMAGVDFQPIGNLALTLAVSGQSGTINVANAGASQLKLAELTGAASYTWEGLRIQSAVTWGHGFHDDTRNVRISDPLTSTNISTKGEDKHQSDRTLIATEIGYRIPVGPVGVEPLAGLDWAWMKQDRIGEKNAGGFGLDVGRRGDQVGSVRGGVRLSTIYEHTAYLGPWLDWMTGTWRPTFDVAWRQYLEGTQRSLSATLQGGADTVPGFRVKGKEDAGGAEIGFGLRLVPKYANRLRLDLRYQSFVGPHTLDQDIVAQATLAF